MGGIFRCDKTSDGFIPWFCWHEIGGSITGDVFSNTSALEITDRTEDSNLSGEIYHRINFWSRMNRGTNFASKVAPEISFGRSMLDGF